MILDHGYLNLIETWGSDERVVESARTSTGKGFRGWPEDEKFIKFLWDNKHATPFEMAGMTIEVKAPIFVFREWHRHRTQSYNEMSARYTEIPEEFYVPSLERLRNGGKHATNKQSSGGAIEHVSARAMQKSLRAASRAAFDTYHELLAQGLARELARGVLPVNTYSVMRASANLRNWLGFLTLRMAPNAQWEIREYANAVGDLIAQNFPRTWGCYVARNV